MLKNYDVNHAWGGKVKKIRVRNSIKAAWYHDRKKFQKVKSFCFQKQFLHHGHKNF